MSKWEKVSAQEWKYGDTITMKREGDEIKIFHHGAAAGTYPKEDFRKAKQAAETLIYSDMGYGYY